MTLTSRGEYRVKPDPDQQKSTRPEKGKNSNREIDIKTKIEPNNSVWVRIDKTEIDKNRNKYTKANRNRSFGSVRYGFSVQVGFRWTCSALLVGNLVTRHIN